MRRALPLLGTSRTSAYVRVESEMRRITFAPGEIDEYAPLVGRLSEGVICPTGCRAMWVSSPVCKNIPLLRQPKSNLQLPPSRPTRGALRDRHERWMRDAMDAAASGAKACWTKDADADGEVVWF